MPWQDWIGTVDAGEPGPDAAAFLDELGRMLDLLRPERLDTAASSMETSRTGDVSVALAHRDDPDAGIDVECGERQAIVSWLGGHEHVDRADGQAGAGGRADGQAGAGGRPWTTVLVDAVAGILRGEYEVVHTYRGQHLVRTSIVDLTAPGRAEVVSESATWRALLPGRAPRRTERHRVDFGAQLP